MSPAASSPFIPSSLSLNLLPLCVPPSILSPLSPPSAPPPAPRNIQWWPESGAICCGVNILPALWAGSTKVSVQATRSCTQNGTSSLVVYLVCMHKGSSPPYRGESRAGYTANQYVNGTLQTRRLTASLYNAVNSHSHNTVPGLKAAWGEQNMHAIILIRQQGRACCPWTVTGTHPGEVLPPSEMLKASSRIGPHKKNGRLLCLSVGWNMACY